MTPEATASDEVRLRASSYNIKLLRNNSGVLPNPQNGRPVRFGLGNESKKINEEMKTGDYIGITPMVITPEMVGKTIGVFTNFEVKAKGFRERDSYPKKTREYGQLNFNNLVKNSGGLAGFVSCWQDVDRLIKNYTDRLKQS